MSGQTLFILILAAALLLYVGFRQLKFRRVRMQLPDMIAAGAQVVDVRSAGEFAGGSHRKAVNIPLDTLSQRLKTLNPAKPVIVCCASGARSAMAEQLLRKAGFTQVVNAGSWANVPA